MTNILFQGKASALKQRAKAISHAIQLLDNTEFDLAPEVNRVALSDARLPGVAGGTFCGHATFGPHGQVLTVGVRQNSKDGVDLIIRNEGSTTRVIERHYCQGNALALTVSAVFGQAGDLISYEEVF